MIMKKFVLAAAAAATLVMTLPAAAQSVTIGVDNGMHRNRGVVHERTYVRPHRDRVVVLKRHRADRAYGYDRRHSRSRAIVIQR